MSGRHRRQPHAPAIGTSSADGMPQSANTPSSTPACAASTPESSAVIDGQPGEHRIDRACSAQPNSRAIDQAIGDRNSRAPDPGVRGLHPARLGVEVLDVATAVVSSCQIHGSGGDHREQRPHAERHAPARGVGDRHGDDGRHGRAERHHGHVERRHRADAVGEVPLHDRRQQHVAAARRRAARARCRSAALLASGASGAEQVAGSADERRPPAARPRGRARARRAERAARRAPNTSGGAAPMIASTR